MNNLSLQDYEKLQNVDISEIICQSCRIRNKGIYIIMNFIDVLHAILICVQIVN